jgi:hypothetical protein
MKHWMFNCKEVTRKVSESLDRELSFHQRVGLRIHLLMCKFCSRYQRQLLFLREAARLYTEHSEYIEPSGKLPSEVRERIKRTVHDILDKPE